MAAKEHEATAFGIRNQRAVIPRFGPHNVDLLPNRSIEAPCVINASFAIPAAEAQHMLARFIIGHHAVEAAWRNGGLHFTPALAVPRPGFARRAVAAKKKNTPANGIISHRRAVARSWSARADLLPSFAIPFPRVAETSSLSGNEVVSSKQNEAATRDVMNHARFRAGSRRCGFDHPPACSLPFPHVRDKSVFVVFRSKQNPITAEENEALAIAIM